MRSTAILQSGTCEHAHRMKSSLRSKPSEEELASRETARGNGLIAGKAIAARLKVPLNGPLNQDVATRGCRSFAGGKALPGSLGQHRARFVLDLLRSRF